MKQDEQLCFSSCARTVESSEATCLTLDVAAVHSRWTCAISAQMNSLDRRRQGGDGDIFHGVFEGIGLVCTVTVFKEIYWL